MFVVTDKGAGGLVWMAFVLCDVSIGGDVGIHLLILSDGVLKTPLGAGAFEVYLWIERTFLGQILGQVGSSEPAVDVDSIGNEVVRGLERSLDSAWR